MMAYLVVLGRCPASHPKIGLLSEGSLSSASTRLIPAQHRLGGGAQPFFESTPRRTGDVRLFAFIDGKARKQFDSWPFIAVWHRLIDWILTCAI